MTDDGLNEPHITGGDAFLRINLPYHSHRITASGISVTSVLRDDGEWQQASCESSWHTGLGRTPEAAILSMLARIVGVDGDEIL